MWVVFVSMSLLFLIPLVERVVLDFALFQLTVFGFAILDFGWWSLVSVDGV